MDYGDLNLVTWPVQLTKAWHRDMYPLLEPSRPELSAKGKTVLVTGASGGVGKAIVKAWAIAGAASIVITGRKVEALNEVAASVIATSPGTKVLVCPADLTDEQSVQELWETVRAKIGAVDVLINDAGSMNYATIGEIEPLQWWNDFEVNVKGPYLMCHHFVKQAQGKNSTVITVGTGAAATIFPNMSSYTCSKLAQAKLMEFLHAEHPQIRSFTLLPGLLKTAMTAKAYLPYALDDPMLSGGLSLFLCTSRADWMQGRVMSVNWDIEEMEAHKLQIQRDGLTKLNFVNAKLGKGGHPWDQNTNPDT
ncbi:hypothetical protein BDV95DRAFT_569698 [Massariosphaeria phaeospora]|uniref:NAD(P)-binding protein n=1 Tax=Massariosphaeria phaeospora TaxID=100035 RepID=A0A7C8MG25_9PLEO|nr:hypothetical protein BDV95DRAFT_569698 [Massariosphaeria phaeospora]